MTTSLLYALGARRWCAGRCSEAEGAPRAVAGQAPVAARACAHGAPGGGAGAVLRVRRGALLPLRRRARRDRRSAAAPASCGWRRSTASASPRRARADRARSQRRHLRPAVHRRLPRAVPVQPLRARAPESRRVRAVVVGRDASPISTATRFYDLTGSYGVNVFGYDFYKECIDARRRARARRSARCSAPTIPSSPTTSQRLQADLRARRGVVPHVGHRGGDAGGAARALSHAALAPGALLRRLPRLVGRRAAGRRQPVAGARDLHAEGHGRATRCACCARAATSPACWSTRCRRCIPNAGAPADSTLVDSAPRRALRPRGLHRLAAARCARSAPSAASC